MTDKTPSQEIDDIITAQNNWKGEILAQLRAIILAADPNIIEEVKWKKPSKPEGVAVWAYDGNLCMVDILKNAVRLNFAYGAQLPDSNSKFFNARLDSTGVRATDFFEGDTVDKATLTDLVHQAIARNQLKAHS
jgi:hypothetical protein